MRITTRTLFLGVLALMTAACGDDTGGPGAIDAAGGGVIDGAPGSADAPSFPDAAGPSTCGNGIREGAEQCDDGNTTSMDGCSATCSFEGGAACNFNGVCDTGEDPAMCPDCGGGGMCNFDGMCQMGEGMSCPDCSMGFVCNFDSACDTGEDPMCPDCTGGGGGCNFDGVCDTTEDMVCPDCSGGGFMCNFDGTCQAGEAMFCPDCP